MHGFKTVARIFILTALSFLPALSLRRSARLRRGLAWKAGIFTVHRFVIPAKAGIFIVYSVNF